MIDARFLPDLAYSSQPRGSAHWNVFTIVDGSYADSYIQLMEEGTIADIDAALPDGAISPFHNGSHCDNLRLYVSSY
jgi:hypothetical protein